MTKILKSKPHGIADIDPPQEDQMPFRIGDYSEGGVFFAVATSTIAQIRFYKFWSLNI